MADAAEKPRVLGLIPARGGSKGIPNKNLVPLGGKPLIAYTIEAARGSALLDDFIVSTDSPEIQRAALELGGNAPFLRPPELATDTAGMPEVALHALDTYRTDTAFDYLLLLQPTSPLRSSADIDACIDLAGRYEAGSVLSFSNEFPYHPHQYYFVEDDGASGSQPRIRPAFTSAIPPRQQFPRAIVRNGAIFMTRVGVLRDLNVFISEDVVPYLMPAERSVNVDGPEDLAWAEFLLSRAER